MNCSMPGFPALTISWSLLKLPSVEPVMLSNHLILCHPLLLLPSILLASESFSMTWLFPSGGQNIGVLASASVLAMNIQGWFHLGLAGLISWLSRGLSRVFSSTGVPKHQFFSAQLSLWPSSHIHTWLLEKATREAANVLFFFLMRRRQRECSDELIVVTWKNWWFSILLTFCVFPVSITGVNYFDKQWKLR